jgi:glycerol uptake facilitator-like aquaporin
MDRNLRPFLAEWIGTFAFVFVSAGAFCTSQLALGAERPQLSQLSIALASGLILIAALAGTVAISGGLLNPAITLTLWVFKRIEGSRALWLIGAQLLGGFSAGLALRLMFAAPVLEEARFGTPHLNLPAFGGVVRGEPSLAMLLSGIGIEFTLTFLFTFVIYTTLLDSRAPQLGVLGPGLAQSALMLMGFSLTGASLNPARWLGPVLWERTLIPEALRDHSPYWIGPVFGALVAGLLGEFLLRPGAERPRLTGETSSSASSPVTSTLFKGKK